MYLLDTFPLDRTIKVLEQYIRKVGRVGIHLKLNLSSGIISVSIFTKCSNSNMIFCAIFGITVVINSYGIDGRIICFRIMYCTYVTTGIQHVHFSSTLTYALLCKRTQKMIPYAGPMRGLKAIMTEIVDTCCTCYFNFHQKPWVIFHCRQHCGNVTSSSQMMLENVF